MRHVRGAPRPSGIALRDAGGATSFGGSRHRRGAPRGSSEEAAARPRSRIAESHGDSEEARRRGRGSSERGRAAITASRVAPRRRRHRVPRASSGWRQHSDVGRTRSTPAGTSSQSARGTTTSSPSWSRGARGARAAAARRAPTRPSSRGRGTRPARRPSRACAPAARTRCGIGSWRFCGSRASSWAWSRTSTRRCWRSSARRVCPT